MEQFLRVVDIAIYRSAALSQRTGDGLSDPRRLRKAGVFGARTTMMAQEDAPCEESPPEGGGRGGGRSAREKKMALGVNRNLKKNAFS